MRSHLAIAGAAAGALALALAGACSDDSQERLNDALNREGIKNVTVTDSKVTAACATGATIELDAAELERNFLGMVKSDRVRVVANKIYKDCEKLDEEKRKADGLKQMIADTAKQLGIDVSALDDTAAKKAICEKLTAQLPLKDPDRAVEDAKNQNKWKCAPAPAVAELPTGAWLFDDQPAAPKKPAAQYLRLVNDKGERLTVKCAAKKPDFYVQVTDAVKKGTKTVDAKVGAAKAAKWKVRPSTDGKALFFVDLKAVFKALGPADTLALSVPGAKSVSTASFKVKGFGESLKKLPKPCQ